MEVSSLLLGLLTWGVASSLGYVQDNYNTGAFGGGFNGGAGSYMNGGGFNGGAGGYMNNVGGGLNRGAGGYMNNVGGGAGGFMNNVGGGLNRGAGGYMNNVGGGLNRGAGGYMNNVGGGAGGYMNNVGGGYMKRGGYLNNNNAGNLSASNNLAGDGIMQQYGLTEQAWRSNIYNRAWSRFGLTEQLWRHLRTMNASAADVVKILHQKIQQSRSEEPDFVAGQDFLNQGNMPKKGTQYVVTAELELMPPAYYKALWSGAENKSYDKTFMDLKAEEFGSHGSGADTQPIKIPPIKTDKQVEAFVSVLKGYRNKISVIPKISPLLTLLGGVKVNLRLSESRQNQGSKLRFETPSTVTKWLANTKPVKVQKRKVFDTVMNEDALESAAVVCGSIVNNTKQCLDVIQATQSGSIRMHIRKNLICYFANDPHTGSPLSPRTVVGYFARPEVSLSDKHSSGPWRIIAFEKQKMEIDNPPYDYSAFVDSLRRGPEGFTDRHRNTGASKSALEELDLQVNTCELSKLNGLFFGEPKITLPFSKRPSDVRLYPEELFVVACDGKVPETTRVTSNSKNWSCDDGEWHYASNLHR